MLLAGLGRLEYRGYDSAGVAIVCPDNTIQTAKRSGKLSVLREHLEISPLANGHTGIAHTRWATHGPPTDVNAHPHLADGGKLALIHNGIIENYMELQAELREHGIECVSDTDSEVAAHLVALAYNESGDLTEALRQTVKKLEGAFTLLVAHQDQPGVVVGARRNSPLVVGLGEGENFLASDVAAFVEHTRNAMALGQDQVVTITESGVSVTDFDGNAVEPERFTVDWDASAAEKGLCRRTSMKFRLPCDGRLTTAPRCFHGWLTVVFLTECRVGVTAPITLSMVGIKGNTNQILQPTV